MEKEWRENTRTNKKRVNDPQVKQILHWKPSVSSAMKYPKCDARADRETHKGLAQIHIQANKDKYHLGMEASGALRVSRLFLLRQEESEA